jgi:uncharacterized membrane protein
MEKGQIPQRQPDPAPELGDQTIESNLQAIAEIEDRALGQRSAGERVGDGVARVIGSMPFVVFHGVWFLLWIGINLRWIPVVRPFDPFPFGLLTLVVSLEAIFLSLFVLISQNRMTRQADRRSHLDLQINLLAEAETTKILRVLERIAEQVGVPKEGQSGTELDSPTDILDLATRVEEKIPESS